MTSEYIYYFFFVFLTDRGDNPSPKTWKANFRCAVNALPDIKPVKGQHNKKGKNACRVFEFSKKRKSREHGKLTKDAFRSFLD